MKEIEPKTSRLFLIDLPENNQVFASKEKRPELGNKITIRFEAAGRQATVDFWNKLENAADNDMLVLRSLAEETFAYYQNQEQLTPDQKNFLFIAKKSVEARILYRERLRFQDELKSPLNPWKKVLPLIREKLYPDLSPKFVDLFTSAWLLSIKKRLPGQLEAEFQRMNKLCETNYKCTDVDLVRAEIDWATNIKSKLENLNDETLHWIKDKGLGVLLLEKKVPAQYHRLPEENLAKTTAEDIPEPEQVFSQLPDEQPVSQKSPLVGKIKDFLNKPAQSLRQAFTSLLF